MVGINGIFFTERLREMIRQYSADPGSLIPNGSVPEQHMDALIANNIEIVPDRRGGKAVIKGTRIAVCDIIADTWSLGNQRDYLLEIYAGTIDRKAVDAAYAFLMRYPEKVEQDFKECFGSPLPKDLYR